MKYSHIVSYVAQSVWSLFEPKMQELLAVLATRAAGHVFTTEEIRARLGGEPPESPESTTRGAVAVIPLRGVIAHRMSALGESSGGMSAERFRAMVNAAAADPGISAIVLDVDSPGGTINGVQDAADAVWEARKRKKVVAVANGMMASAAYWIGSQAEEIVAAPGLLDRSIGSIGVFTVHQDLSAHLEKEGIKISIIRAGKHKFETNPFEPLSDEARADIQATVDASYNAFVKAVARGRGVSVADIRSGYGQGRALPAAEAKAAGLVDRVGTIEDTIAQLSGRRRANGVRAEEVAEAFDVPEEQLAHVEDANVETQAAAAVAGDADRRRRLERF